MPRKSKTVINLDNDKRKLTKDKIQKRERAEKGMQGERDKLNRVPIGMTLSQKKIFKGIVSIDNEREESFRILSNSDIENIRLLAIELDNYNMLEEMKRNTTDVEILLKIIKTQDAKYPKLEKGLERLGMTPQGRADKANVMSKGEQGQSVLSKILLGDNDD